MRLHVNVLNPAGRDVRILLHGMGGWFDARFVEELAADARVLYPDLPGYGRSPPPDGSPLEAARDAIVALVEQQPPEARVSLVGYSLGGQLALRVALAVGKRLDRLALLSPLGSLTAEERQAYRDFAAIIEGNRLPKADLDAALVARFTAPAWAAAHPDEIALMLERFHQVDARNLVRELRAVAEIVDLGPELGSLAVPVHLWRGDADAAISLESVEELVRAIPGAALTRLPGVGHHLSAEAAGLARAVRSWLAGTEGLPHAP